MSDQSPLPPDFDPHHFPREPGQMPEGGCIIMVLVLLVFPVMITAAVTALYWLVWVMGRGLGL